VPLLLLDLDNTLVDREGAFHRWAVRFVGLHDGGPDDMQWLVEADADGYRAREDVALAVGARFGLPSSSVQKLVTELRAGLVDEMTVEAPLLEALAKAKEAGWTPYAVTNGTVAQQERKIRHLGLDKHLAGWAISEGVGCKKPDAGIFQHAAAAAGLTLDDAWMIGDSADADIAGAHALGILSTWIHRRRPWPDRPFQPTRQASSCTEAILSIIDPNADEP